MTADYKQAETWKDFEAFAADGEFATLDSLLDWVNKLDALLKQPDILQWQRDMYNRERVATLEILKIKGYL